MMKLTENGLKECCDGLKPFFKSVRKVRRRSSIKSRPSFKQNTTIFFMFILKGDIEP